MEKRTVELEIELWSFLCSGIRDLIDVTKDQELKDRNQEVLDKIESQVYKS